MMNISLQSYASVTGADVIDHLRQLARPLSGMKIVHVNSTKSGGGVAEILVKLVPFMNELGMTCSWEVVTGEAEFYECTKRFHNGLQGNAVTLSPGLLKTFEKTNAANAERLRKSLAEADIVFIHDPQPVALLRNIKERKGKWIWRCHIDLSHPFRPVWTYLRPYVQEYDASIFSLADFAQPLPHIQYLIPPSIDPLSEKNMDLDDTEIAAVLEEFHIDRERPLAVQISRFDRFKDPVGVIQAYRLTKRFIPSLQLVLAGGGATDDPEGAVVLKEVNDAVGKDQDIHVLLLPPDAHRKINALQRAADIVLQKSTREGFGLTVTEALWKSRPVIGGDTGGIRLQVVDHYTGFLVQTPEGAALRMQYLLRHPDIRRKMGRLGHVYVRDNFLLTRHLREYLTLILSLISGDDARLELS